MHPCARMQSTMMLRDVPTVTPSLSRGCYRSTPAYLSYNPICSKNENENGENDGENENESNENGNGGS